MLLLAQELELPPWAEEALALALLQALPEAPSLLALAAAEALPLLLPPPPPPPSGPKEALGWALLLALELPAGLLLSEALPEAEGLPLLLLLGAGL